MVHQDSTSRHWWEAVSRRELLVQQCPSCEVTQHPPGPWCRGCRRPGLAWRAHRGAGTLVGCSEVHTTTYPDRVGETPYWVAVVDLGAEHDDAYLVTNLVDLRGREPKVGDPVMLSWSERGGRMLPTFAPAGDTGGAS